MVRSSIVAFAVVVVALTLLNEQPTNRVATPAEAARFVTVPQNCPGGVCPLPTRNYQRQWFNHDGLSLRQHAEHVHGHDVSGLSDSQIAAMNDHDHNTWGSGHHYVSSTSRTVSYSTSGSCPAVATVRTPVRSVVRAIRVRQPVRSFLRSKPIRRALGRVFCR